MFGYLARKFFGSANDRIISSMGKIVAQINALEETMVKLTDSELANQTFIFKNRLKGGENLDHILPEAFATVREVAKRILNMRHFDAQMIGGIILHQGKIAEMKTGEGKTLVATAPVYLNALTGHGVHVVTVNDYLASRDAAWMGKIYEFLGLKVACITSNTDVNARREAYRSDIVYGTNNEFGFDYLRDNLQYHLKDMVHRAFNYAVIDEVDSILIDEARTPMIISGPMDYKPELYNQINSAVLQLDQSDIEIDHTTKAIHLTEKGHSNIEEIFKKSFIIDHKSSLYDFENMSLVHHLNQALKANHLFRKDVDYIVKDHKVMIVDEFTGRIMDGRRYSEGLHQAIEAKEKVQIKSENQTLASTTFQNYFRMYQKLAGMTGTAMTEASEFADIYGLEVASIPPHLKVQRIDEHDQVYKTIEEKYDAIVEEIKRVHEIGQPILVGTISIEKSEILSAKLKKIGLPHNVLNARYHEQEAEIIAQAGRFKAITISTNMAGRGTDIMLGGCIPKNIVSDAANKKAIEKMQAEIIDNKEKVLKAGGLLVIGTERHESRRIDNQLRGRAGRQGDIGKTQFFLSLEDDLIRMFTSEMLSKLLTTLGLKKGEAIVHPWINKSLEKAQQKLETRNYEIRKNLLKFDDVLNEQRKIVYSQRLEVMKNQNMIYTLQQMIQSLNNELVDKYFKEEIENTGFDFSAVANAFYGCYGFEADLPSKSIFELRDVSENLNKSAFKELEKRFGSHDIEDVNYVLREVFLQKIDTSWREHINALERLRNGISLRAYAQQDPLNEYKIEAFKLFEYIIESLDSMIISACFMLEMNDQLLKKQNDDSIGQKIEEHKQSRNSLCYCNSGKKFKYCHGMF